MSPRTKFVSGFYPGDTFRRTKSAMTTAFLGWGWGGGGGGVLKYLTLHPQGKKRVESFWNHYVIEQ